MNLLAGIQQTAGYRLSKMELYNWGTFDDTVHGFHPRGEWTLLVGENGTGKSTIVDALLTLLVRPNTRKYNFASGAAKTERDERTYIQGAYDKVLGPTGTPQLKYLRPGNKHYSALLACFENYQTGKVFTIGQILYLDSNNKPKKFYAFDDKQERGIAEDFGNISEYSSVLTTLKNRNFKVTETYTQYFEWLRRKVSCLPKAMDMFNQAAWVKDVSQLDSFVRDQMLEKHPWDEKVSQLLKHFSELNEAHRSLVIIRDQAKMLAPIVEEGMQYRELNSKLILAKNQLKATSLYFNFATERLLEPLCDLWTNKITSFKSKINELDKHIFETTREIAQIDLEIIGAGGERMSRLPGLISIEQERADHKRKARIEFESLLYEADIEGIVNSANEFTKIQSMVTNKISAKETNRKHAQNNAARIQYEIGLLRQRISDDREELSSLQTRKGNMPRELVFVRDEICRELKISVKDLPFAAELIAIVPEHREWEASIEQVLSGFARDLLVKDQHYAKVSGYIDHKRLSDKDGRGQRLNYTRVVAEKITNVAPSGKHFNQDSRTLFSMLKFREDHDLAAWVRGKIADRFDFLACDNIDEFQQANHAAMTKNRHIKRTKEQHSKDDRGRFGDRKQFVLGWENRDKILALKNSIADTELLLDQLELNETELNNKINKATNQISYLNRISEFKDYDLIDEAKHRKQIAEYQLELHKLKDSNDKIRELESKKKDLEVKQEGDRLQSKTLSDECSKKENELENGIKCCKNAVRAINEAKQDRRYDSLEVHFESIETLLVDEPLTLDNITTLPQKFTQDRIEEVDSLEKESNSISKPIMSKMSRFLSKFPEFQSDMSGSIDSLLEFIELHKKIEQDDLPRHENRFKERLNEKVLHEVGVLNSHLENEREEIIGKIEEINYGLRRIEWNPGTYIRLEPEDGKDAEIRDFRRDLAACLTGYLNGTMQADEETFLRIQKLVNKLSDDSNIRWREKVIDVRRWFSFSARELVKETGEPRSYYDGGAGKSGGEKAKLAFLVLVAAIVYQYDIDPDASRSDKYHFVMIDEMFSRTASKYAKYALELFEQFGLQLLIVAPLDAKARVCESYVGLHAHVVKDGETNRSEILSYSSEHSEEFIHSHASMNQK
ncbi:hypothetical protein Pan153_52930 [Gimesia panareensis]|uniref:Chromosome partition protein Smc n=1 Tax=Gimesia panareensis TaxID=2527978 RepID=A0A518FW77_9PLAN|nr:ATP-binding protein [Gimesia panareensis]QDV20617.1 hypothetical protein Pan153_52930 [Gimesia panareensis]